MSLDIKVLKREPEAATYEGNGVVRHYYKQWASVEVDGIVNSFQFSTDEPIPAGPAELDASSFSILNGKLGIGRLRLKSALKPVAAPAVAAAAAGK